MTTRFTTRLAERVRPARLGDETGSVLIVVIAVTGLLSLLVGVSFTVAKRSIVLADGEQRTHGALAAAEAGLDDYIFRLNNVDEYWNYDHDTPAPDGNTAFIDPSILPSQIDPADPAWTPVPGGGEFGEYVYSVDTSQLPSDGVIRLEATGRILPASNASLDYRTRTVVATVKQKSFLDFLYFTDFETLDPIAYSGSSNQAWAERNCRVHRWEQNRPSGCIEIYWTSRDVVNGPFHTNDRWRISGNPTWTNDVSGSAIDLDFYTGSGSPRFQGGDPFYQRKLEMPPSNSQLRTLADYENGGEGCLYTGPTEIITRSDGRLRIDSPYTRESGPGCGTFSGNGNDSAQTVNLPANGVIYVQPIPGSASDPNYTSGCPFGNNGLGYPIRYDDNDYSCRDGDAFVEGTLNGRLTIAAANDIVITWHLLYAGTDDMLGLIANDFVQIYHPVDRGRSRSYENLDARPNHSSEFRNPQINAAILSVNHSFMVQEWRYGDSRLGTIELNGAIAQIFRGPVGTFSGGSRYSGYDKDYNYDERLRYTNPPHFIDPVKASWRIIQFAEQFD